MMEGITGIFIFFMIGVFPFYFHDNYLDIVWAKKSFFQTAVAILLVFGVVFGIPACIKERSARLRDGNGTWAKWSLTDSCALLFMAIIVISCCISPGGEEAFWGNQGRRLGGFFLILCICCYFVVSRFYKKSQLILWTFLLANIGINLLVLMNFWGLDPLKMYGNLVEYQHTYFIGTMGNININAGYGGVVAALMMGLYYLAKEKLSRVCFWMAAMLGIYAGYAVRSDSWLLSVGGAYVVILFLAMKSRDKLEKWWKLCLCFFFASLVMKFTEILDRACRWDLLRIQDLREQSLLCGLLDWSLLAVEAVLLGLAYVLLKGSFVLLLQKYGRIALTVGIGAAVIAAAVWIFPLKDSFGSDRGYIWKRTLENFVHAPVWQKLFGCGPNCFLLSMEEKYGIEMRQLYGMPFLDAHNEFLQFLAVTGIAGAFSYFGLQISLLVSCIREKNSNPLLSLGCIGVTAYLLQGLVNNPQVFTSPLLFLFLGIMENMRKNAK